GEKSEEDQTHPPDVPGQNRCDVAAGVLVAKKSGGDDEREEGDDGDLECGLEAAPLDEFFEGLPACEFEAGVFPALGCFLDVASGFAEQYEQQEGDDYDHAACAVEEHVGYAGHQGAFGACDDFF